MARVLEDTGKLFGDEEWIAILEKMDEAERDPPDLPVHTSAARSFFRVTTDLLRRQGRPAPREWLLHVIGESGGNFAAAVKGSRGGSMTRVQTWIERWNRQEVGQLRLVTNDATAWVMTALCCSVHPEDPELLCFRIPNHPMPHMGSVVVPILPGRVVNVLKEGLKEWP